MKNLRRKFALVFVFCNLLIACSSEKIAFNATDITGAPFAKTLALTDHNGKARTLDDFKGKLVLVSFGFTSCPDFCPATLALWADIMKQLGADASKVQGIFVTVDPERDTQDLLSKYVPAFHPSFLGLRGDAAQTKATAAEFKIVFQKNVGNTPETYTVDHSTQTYVFDTQGRVRLMVPHGMEATKLSADLKTLLREQRS